MDTSDYITIAIWFECNNRCRTCMLSGDYDAPSSSEYQSLVRAYSKKYSGLILSGREVTTFPGLVGYVKYARDYFSHIMIQTNARKLADKVYFLGLLDAGVNEFYISLSGSNSHLHERNTLIDGSFNETIEGIKRAASRAETIINIVVTKNNYRDLSNIINLVKQFNVDGVELWNYLPMSSDDLKNLTVSPLKSIPEVQKAIKRACEINIPISVKYFPHCLMGEYSLYIDDSQPETIIDKRHWVKYSYNQFQCSANCKEKCIGFPVAYLKKYPALNRIGEYNANRKKDD